MKRRLVALTLAAITVFSVIGAANTTFAASYLDRANKLAATNTGTETGAPQPDQVVFHTDKETKDIIRGMFDPEFYAYVYPDVSYAYGITDAKSMTEEQKEKLWEHFWNGGIWAGRACNANFNASVYASAYGDLQKEYGNDIISYYTHYAKAGKAENRTITTVEAAIDAGVPVYNPIVCFEKGLEGVKPEILKGAGVNLVVDSVSVKEARENAKAEAAKPSTAPTTPNIPSVSETPVTPSAPEVTTPETPSNPETPSTPSEPIKPAIPTKPDELIEGKFWGLCYGEAYQALKANGITDDHIANYIHKADYKDSYQQMMAKGPWFATKPDEEKYLEETSYEEDYREYNRAYAEWEADPENHEKPAEINRYEYLAKTNFPQAYTEWYNAGPRLKDYCDKYDGPDDIAESFMTWDQMYEESINK